MGQEIDLYSGRDTRKEPYSAGRWIYQLEKDSSMERPEYATKYSIKHRTQSSRAKSFKQMPCILSIIYHSSCPFWPTEGDLQYLEAFLVVATGKISPKSKWTEPKNIDTIL